MNDIKYTISFWALIILSNMNFIAKQNESGIFLLVLAIITLLATIFAKPKKDK